MKKTSPTVKEKQGPEQMQKTQDQIIQNYKDID